MSAQLLMTVGPGDALASDKAMSSAQSDAIFDLALLAPGLVSADITSVVIDPAWVETDSPRLQALQTPVAAATPQAPETETATMPHTGPAVFTALNGSSASIAPSTVVPSTPEADRLLSDALIALAALEQTGRRGVSGQKPEPSLLSQELKMRLFVPERVSASTEVQPFRLSMREPVDLHDGGTGTPDLDTSAQKLPSKSGNEPLSVTVIARESLRATSAVSLPLLMNDIEFITTPITIPPVDENAPVMNAVSPASAKSTSAMSIRDDHADDIAAPVGELIEKPRSIILPNRPMPVTPTTPLREPMMTEPAPALLFDAPATPTNKNDATITEILPTPSPKTLPKSAQKTSSLLSLADESPASFLKLDHDNHVMMAREPTQKTSTHKPRTAGLNAPALAASDRSVHADRTKSMDDQDQTQKDDLTNTSLVMTPLAPALAPLESSSNRADNSEKIMQSTPRVDLEQSNSKPAAVAIHNDKFAQTSSDLARDPEQNDDPRSVMREQVISPNGMSYIKSGDQRPAIMPEQLATQRDGAIDTRPIPVETNSAEAGHNQQFVDQAHMTSTMQIIVKDQPLLEPTTTRSTMVVSKTDHQSIVPAAQAIISDHPASLNRLDDSRMSNLPETTNTLLARSPFINTEAATKPSSILDRSPVTPQMTHDDTNIIQSPLMRDERGRESIRLVTTQDHDGQSPHTVPAQLSTDKQQIDLRDTTRKEALPLTDHIIAASRESSRFVSTEVANVVTTPRVASPRLVKLIDKATSITNETNISTQIDQIDVILPTEERPAARVNTRNDDLTSATPSSLYRDDIYDDETSVAKDIPIGDHSSDRPQGHDSGRLVAHDVTDHPTATASVTTITTTATVDHATSFGSRLHVTSPLTAEAPINRDVTGAPTPDARPATTGYEIQRERLFESQLIAAVKAGRDEVRISLYPAQLGQVTLNLALEGQKVKVSLKTNNREATDLLSAERPLLSQALHHEGFSLEGFDVTEDDSQHHRKAPEPAPPHPFTPPSSGTSEFFIDITI